MIVIFIVNFSSSGGFPPQCCPFRIVRTSRKRRVPQAVRYEWSRVEPSGAEWSRAEPSRSMGYAFGKRYHVKAGRRDCWSWRQAGGSLEQLEHTVELDQLDGYSSEPSECAFYNLHPEKAFAINLSISSAFPIIVRAESTNNYKNNG